LDRRDRGPPFSATSDPDPKRWRLALKSGEADKFDDLPGAQKPTSTSRKSPTPRKPGQKPQFDECAADALVAFINTLADKDMH
jgi:hypothetical protein